MGCLEFGGKNGTGKFGVSIAILAGVGRTISGVTITISSVFVLFLVLD